MSKIIQVEARERLLSVDYIEALVKKPQAPGEPPLYKDAELQKRVEALRAFMKPLGIDGAPEYHWPKPWVTRTLIMRELPKPRETYVQIGGDFLRHGDRVSPGVPAVLSSKPVSGNRLDLAKWLVDPSNPLTARVTVNRMWQEYFGKGIVETQDDFGIVGARPTHPELLDWLATEFMARGWSQKAIHRLIVTSATYRQSAKDRPDVDEVDPYNKLLAHQSRMRQPARSLSFVYVFMRPSMGAPGLREIAPGI